MLSCPLKLDRFVQSIYYLALVSQFTASHGIVNSGRQLLDCTTIRPIGNINNQSICDDALPESSFNTKKLPEPADESLVTRILSIDFNNILKRRHIRGNENCTNDHMQTTDVVCAPNNRTYGASTKAISITIVPNVTDQFTIDALTLRSNSTNVIHCHFSLSPASNVTELDFKLRWLRSVNSQNGLRNQSISSDVNEHAQYQISVSISRVSTAQREGGLDLILNDATSGDSGDYFCQAIASNNSVLDEQRIHLKIHNENRSNLNPLDQGKLSPNDYEDASGIYSADNLAKLMPSLTIIPDYAELALGESTQLACVTSGLDPDPEPEKIEWTFEPFERPGYVPSGANLRPTGEAEPGLLPSNTTQVGNVLIIWSMSYETIGIYKCFLHMDELNLTAEASGELALRPNSESAPIVFMTPELLRLSAKGSARVQCECTGYPPPRIEWYRVETASITKNSIKPDVEATDNPQHAQSNPEFRSSLDSLDGLEVHQLKPQDSMAFCLRSGCRALDNLDLVERQNLDHHRNKLKHKTLVTGLSWIQIDQARASHQGQYVCKATNKHGSNQASSIIDVEFKELPRVDIPNEHRHQVIVLDERDGFDQSNRLHSINFNCSLEAGQPKPRLRWLRTNWRKNHIGKKHTRDMSEAANTFGGHDYLRKLKSYSGSSDDLEIYDLTSVSSATSRVSTQSHDDGKTLVLQLSTISVDDEGDYVCLGENELGRHSAVAHLVVRKSAKVRILQTSPKIFRPNESFQLDCLVSGHPNPIDIEWSRSDKGAFFALISRHSPTITADQERAVLKFDRVTGEDSGEYTCAARDPMNQAIILKDTIMLMAEESSESSRGDYHQHLDVARQFPKLLVRPTKITAESGSNVSLDCIAVSGLQPTIVEWLAPSTALSTESESLSREHVTIRPYYRSQLVNLAQDSKSSSLLQFGSRLRLFNVSKSHEGVYQCKGRNKVGVENAPAFVEIIDKSSLSGSKEGSRLDDDNGQRGDSRGGATKTKIAKMGTNIELRCQVNGTDGTTPATSWSREDRELPNGSVQIDHNLWIQNLTKADEGLYLCSARSSEPNEILQARIRLLISEVDGLDKGPGDGKLGFAKLDARIIPSKTHLIEGDSVTLECVINLMDGNNSHSKDSSGQRSAQFVNSNDLAELERQVIWTNLQSGESLFQDNVYIQSNLLIVYDLKRENSATYRCNYNDLTQFTDYKLIVAHNESSVPGGDSMDAAQHGANPVAPNQQQTQDVSDKFHVQNVTQFLWDHHQTKHVIVPMGTRKVLECKSQSPNDEYFWTFNSNSNSPPPKQSGSFKQAKNHGLVGSESHTLTIDQIDTNQTGLYQCNKRRSLNSSHYDLDTQFLVEVSVVAAKFVQRPVSFVTLPAVSDADHRLELELKFYPENEHGLMLFSGGVLNNLISNQQHSTPEQSNRTSASFTNVDYISLGLVRGYLEFRFELGDGATMVRSSQPIEMNRWHKVLIERNRRGASMWVDGQNPSSNTSLGKFFNLDLDSLLYVGGHQVFLSISNSISSKRQQGWRKHSDQNSANLPDRVNNQSSPIRSFYGFSRGFKGCISSLKINQRELNLMARNRSVTVGIFECDKSECPTSKSTNLTADSKQFDCPSSRGVCQIDRTIVQPTTRQGGAPSSETKRVQSYPNDDLRCLCFPNFSGPACNETVQRSTTTKIAPATIDANKEHKSALASCNSTSHCDSDGTSQCESLSSTSYKCHCKLGFTGKICDHPVTYANETSVGFNQSAHIQLAFKSAQEALDRTLPDAGRPVLGLNEIEYTKSITFTEHQNISFLVQTRASYGLLLYIGQDLNPNNVGALKIDTNVFQSSKSIVANALSRLTITKVSDFLAVALVDGHIELSYELGSGLAVLRSSKRYNDGSRHKIEISRSGKGSELIIDDAVKHETQSPGKLSMLNVGQDIYLGGLPAEFLKLLSVSGSGSSGSLLATFMGCLSDLQINSLGPINLVRSDHMTQLKSARNLVPCGESLLSPPRAIANSPVVGDKISIDQEAIKPMMRTTATTTSTPTIALRKTTRKPTKPSYSSEGDGDDSDELARSS